MNTHSFDDRQIAWQTMAGFEHLQYSILDIDPQQLIIDVLFKFAAGQRIVLHRHMALNKMLVIQGEHRLYHADGSLKDIRPTGRYTSSPASDEPHSEGGGEQDAIVLFSIRGGSGVLYQILDASGNWLADLNWQDFVDLYQAQLQHGVPS